MKRLPLRPLELAAIALIAIVVIAVPFLGSRLATYNLTITALYAPVVIGLNLLLGVAGQVSFAQTVFMAVGGSYSSALLTTRFGWNPWLAMAAGAAMAIVLAYVVGRPLLRLRGHYLAMATFALALGTLYFANAAIFITNGGIGLSGVPALAIGALSFADPRVFYVLAWAICALVLAGYVLLTRSHIGRAWRALATGQDIAAALGIDVTRYKLLAFAIAAFVAAISGSLYVEFTSFVGPDLYDVSVIINIFFMLFVGGRGSVAGPILGAAVLLVVPQWMGGLERYQNLIFFLFLLLLMLIRPDGLLGRTREQVPLVDLLPKLAAARAPRRRAMSPELISLRLEHVTKRFGGLTAVTDVSLALPNDTILGLIGPNGAGKSTTINLISGFLRIDAGGIFFGDRDLTRLDPFAIARLGISRTFQQAAPLVGLSVLENVIVGMHTHYRAGMASVLLRTGAMRREAGAMLSAARELLAMVELDREAELQAADLTFGQLRFLEIARAMAMRPRLLLLDEPAAGLNRPETDRLAALIRNFRSAGIGILLVDHDVPFVFNLCDRVTVMNFGTVIAAGVPNEVYRDPAVREAYLGTDAAAEA